MGDKTKIAWTDATWNTIVGCSKTSPGCRECYAEKLLASRMKHMPIYGDVTAGGKWTGQTGLLPHRLDQPLRWKRPRKIFVNDLGDTFHETVQLEFIAAIWAVMILAHWHTFQVLTKRPARMLEVLTSPLFYRAVLHAAGKIRRDRPSALLVGISDPVKFPAKNIHLGVTAEDQQVANERIPLLLKCPAAVRWVSAEPLLGPIDFNDIVRVRIQCEEHFDALGCDVDPEDDDFGGAILDWIVCGGESGPNARPFAYEWALDIRQQCERAGTAYFHKQMGSDPYVENWNIWDLPDGQMGYPIDRGPMASCRVKLRDRAGADPSEWPEDLRVREWPELDGRVWAEVSAS